jgi:lysozyme
MPTTDVIDISHWQDKVDFAAIKKAGVVGVIAKCTEGTSYIDPTYEDRMNAAIEAGLCWGAYHFLKHGDIAAQMEWFDRNHDLSQGSRIAIDYEDSPCTLGDLQQALEALSKIDGTQQICVYAGGLLKGQIDPNKVYPWLEPYPLWLAQYTSGKISWPTNVWPTWTLWQFSDKGTVPGVSGACDVNAFNGTPENCARWFGPAMPPQPGPAPSDTTVKIAIDVPEGVNLQLVVNGEVLI